MCSKSGNEILVFNSYSNFVGISSRGPDVCGLQDKDVAQGHLQGERVGPGGPHQVGKHPTDLGHVLNHAKALNPDTKLVLNSYSNFVGLAVFTSGQGRCPRPSPG